ncbi:DUF3822 family protein [Winogradskyella sp. UBA3174]|mgnify:CR=1 FL=1|uniref:DUF3822 family protein n=1 Tax=Winogradskyella sp. UBA3174 TaxID=1947785 RepID=UPI0025DE26FC|nr:DUF3822 family protein [Winogradskyella sp. UBA3174]
MTKNNIKELSIQVNLNGLSFCILNRTSNTIEYINSIQFEQRLTPLDLLNHLKTELSSNAIFSEEFDAVLIIHHNELSTLVPKALYQENQKADYLKFNSKILRTDFITQDDLAINDTVNVYVPYININNYIFETFGEFVYKHSSTILVDSALQQVSKNKKTNIYINVNTNTIEVLVVDNNKLQLVNTFDYYSKEDFTYYILFVFEQLKLDVETCQIKLSGKIDTNSDLYNILYRYVRYINIIDTNFTFEIPNTIHKDNLHHHYLILNSF